MECWAQMVAAHPVESIVALCSIGVGTMLGRMVHSRLQAVANWVVLLVGHIAAKIGGERRNGKQS